MQKDTLLKDQKLIEVQKQTETVVARAQAFLLDSEKQLGVAAEVLSWLAAQKKKFEERRKFFVKPLNDQVDRINELFKDYVKPLTDARAIMDEKIIAWNRKKEEGRRIEEERIREEAEKLAKANKVSVQEIIASSPVQEVPKTVGTLTITKRWTFAILAPEIVPKEYLRIDEYKIKDAIQNGVRAIPGVKIYEKEATSTR